MAAVAYLVHRMPGRARLRVPSQKAHEAYFARLTDVLSRHPLVGDVTTNAVTGSAVIRHAGDLDEVLRFAADRALFTVARADPESDETLRRVHDRLGALDAVIKSRSDGAWGLSSLSFYGLIGAAAYQMVRGDFLPAGGTLLIQAFKVLTHAAQTAHRE